MITEPLFICKGCKHRKIKWLNYFIIGCRPLRCIHPEVLKVQQIDEAFNGPALIDPCKNGQLKETK